jgi:hypothetical protein
MKTHDDMERLYALGRTLNKLVIGTFDRKHDLAQLFSDQTGMTLSTAKTYISDYCTGCFKFDDAGADTVFLKRFAVFYDLLGIQEGDPLVKQAQRINPDFQYPFEEKPEPIQSTCTLGVHFSDPELKLTDGQKQNLEHMALEYARRTFFTGKDEAI